MMYVVNHGSNGIVSSSNIRTLLIIIVSGILLIGIYKHFNKKEKKESFRENTRISIMDLKEFDDVSDNVKQFYNDVFVKNVFPHFVKRIKEVISRTRNIDDEKWNILLKSPENTEQIRNIVSFLKNKINGMIPDEIPITWLEVIMSSLPQTEYESVQGDRLINSSEDIVTQAMMGVKSILPGNLNTYSFDQL